MSELPRKRLAAEMEGQQDEPPDKENLIKAHARRKMQSMISNIRYGKMEIKLDALMLFFRDDVADEFFETLPGLSEISSVSVEITSCDTHKDVYETHPLLGQLPC